LRDRDTKFSQEFDDILADEGTTVHKIPFKSPNLNAIAERYVQTARRECLDHFLIFGESHLRYLLSEFNLHYHEARPHQGLGNVPPCGPPPPEVSRVTTEHIVCRQRLGGLLKDYRRVG
jgi:putative transposase